METKKHRDGTFSVRMTEVEWNQVYNGLISAFCRDIELNRQATNNPMANATAEGAKFAEHANNILNMMYPLTNLPKPVAKFIVNGEEMHKGDTVTDFRGQ